ncbi:MAG TPA: hypothetical protein VF490_07850 [Chryseosolibacter sp.]
MLINLNITLPGRQKEEHNPSKRLLRRLRIALLIWLICFIAALIWFSLTR